jgi:hypothetical protein
MKWIILFLQLFSLRSESRTVIENAKAAAEKARRAALFSLYGIFAACYFLAGTILGAVEIGLQVERGEALRLSGLLCSSLALLLAALVILLAGLLFTRSSRSPSPPPPEPHGELTSAWETFLVAFLGKLAEKLKEPSEAREKGEP